MASKAKKGTRIRAIQDRPVEKKQDVAQDLHDGVCQTLTAVELLASVLSRRLEKENSKALDDIRELRRLIGRAREELQAAVRDLKGRS